MEFEKEERAIRDFTELLKSERGTLAEQLRLAKKEYPLLALAYEIQQVTIEELLAARTLESIHMGSVYEALFGDRAVDTEATIEREEEMRELNNCLARSTTYQSGLACFNDDD